MACFGSDLPTLQTARAVLEDVFARVQPDSFYERPLPLRHRIIFYLGHVEAFDWNLLRESCGLTSFDPKLDQLFAFGIDPDSNRPPSDVPADWPEMNAVAEYCSTVRGEVDLCWPHAPELLRHVAIEHRLMHAETLAYMLHNMEHQRLIAPARESIETQGPVQGELAEIPSGEATLGRCACSGFGWDNEFPRVRIPVDAFTIGRWKVTNGEYSEFVRAGAAAPHYWKQINGRWYLRRMFDEIPLPPDWPVWVTQQEAAAYAEWRGGALPSEAQWHRAASGIPENPAGNFDARRWDPDPVTAHRESAGEFGVEELYGNSWEWTSSLFRPFDGFQPFAFYPGYSANFFDDDHYVLKGASPRTDGVFVRRSFRNWFRKDYPYLFAGFRCIHKSR